MDPFTQKRLQQTLEKFKTSHGRDPSEADVLAAGFDKDQLQWALKRKIIKKFQVQMGSGQVENRYSWVHQGALKL